MQPRGEVCDRLQLDARHQTGGEVPVRTRLPSAATRRKSKGGRRWSEEDGPAKGIKKEELRCVDEMESLLESRSIGEAPTAGVGEAGKSRTH